MHRTVNYFITIFHYLAFFSLRQACLGFFPVMPSVDTKLLYQVVLGKALKILLYLRSYTNRVRLTAQL